MEQCAKTYIKFSGKVNVYSKISYFLYDFFFFMMFKILSLGHCMEPHTWLNVLLIPS